MQRPEAATTRNGNDPSASSTAPGRCALVLANRLPFPLDDGWKVRTFHIVRCLSATLPVTLVVLEDSGDFESAARAFGPAVRIVSVPKPKAYTFRNLILGTVSRTPVHIWNQHSRDVDERVRRLVAQTDPAVVVAASTFVYRHLRPVSVPRIVDTHNVDSLTFARYARTMKGPKRWYASLTARKLAGWERAVYRSASEVWTCSDEDAGLVAAAVAEASIRTVPNGVDTATLSPLDAEPDPHSVLFFGRLDYFPNIDGIRWFADHVLPRLSAISDLEWRLLGQAATPAVKEIAARARCARLLGRVDDIRPELARAAVVVVPLRVGGGTRLKILEALAMGRPVVSTTVGAEGLDLEPGREIVLADDPVSFAAAVTNLLGDADLAARIGKAGREAVERRYDWRIVGKQVAESIHDLVAG